MTYSVSQIEVGNDGRVVLNDEELIAMEGLYDATTAGGDDNQNELNDGCINQGDCSGSSNTGCTNQTKC